MNSDAGKLTGLQLAVTAAALEGDAAAIYHLVRDLLSEGMPLSAVLFEVLAPVQAAMGHRWQTADYLISEEHAATSAIATVVALLAGSLEQPEDAPRVVVAAVQGDVSVHAHCSALNATRLRGSKKVVRSMATDRRKVCRAAVTACASSSATAWDWPR